MLKTICRTSSIRKCSLFIYRNLYRASYANEHTHNQVLRRLPLQATSSTGPQFLKLRSVCDTWKPFDVSMTSRRAVQKKYDVANTYMAHLCNFLDNPIRYNLRETCLKLRRKYKLGPVKSQDPFTIFARGHHRVYALKVLTARIYQISFWTISNYPLHDHRKFVKRVLNWSSRNQNNFKTGMRLMDSINQRLASMQHEMAQTKKSQNAKS